MVLLLALCVRAVAVFQYEADHPHADHPVAAQAEVEATAGAVAAGEGFGDATLFRPPLYPAFAAAVFAAADEPSRPALRWTQVGLGALTCVLAALLAGRLFGQRAGLCTGLVAALHRPALLLPALAEPANLAAPLALCGALILTAPGEGRRRWAALGLVGGLGALLRVEAVPLVALCVLWPMARARLAGRNAAGALPDAALVAVIAALVVGPITLRNQIVGGDFVPVTWAGGPRLYEAHHPDRLLDEPHELPWLRGSPSAEADEWEREAELRIGRDLDVGTAGAFWRARTLASVAEHPLVHAAVAWRNLRQTLGAREAGEEHCLEWDARHVAVLRALPVGFGVWGAAGLAGLLAYASLGRRGRAAAGTRGGAVLAVLCAAEIGVLALRVPDSWARLPLVALLFPFAGWWLASAWSAVRAREEGAIGAGRLLGTLGVGLALVHAPVLSAERRAADLARCDHRLAVQLLEVEGRLDEAATAAEALLERDPQSVRARILAARVDLQLGEDPDRADGEAASERGLARLEGVLAGAAATERERSVAARLAARFQARAGRLEDADRLFRSARGFAVHDRALLLEHLDVLLALAERAEEVDGRGEWSTAIRGLLAGPALGGRAGSLPVDLADRWARLSGAPPR
ncbi:MAG: glycosyltransferase family 39 protein [Planctomycetota bacterium]|nr:glycosyltransferase family 39 protein [Planctomycetota bacterium]